jgi:hypothetical protein
MSDPNAEAWFIFFVTCLTIAVLMPVFSYFRSR